jgi:hypothetical protein
VLHAISLVREVRRGATGSIPVLVGEANAGERDPGDSRSPVWVATD